MSCNANAMTANELPSMTSNAGPGRALQWLVDAACAVRNLLASWLYRIRYRYELYELSPRQLADMGIERDALHREINKPFWID